MLSLGQRLRDRYRIDALPESNGGFNVYRAFDTVENRICAIKEFEGETAARLEREAESLTLHRHPNLPTAHDAFTLDSRLYLVLEWPEGESLQSRLKRDGRLPEADSIRYLSQILSALDYIHTLNLPIGRSGFAPAHIWIAPDGRPRLYAGVAALTSAAPYVAPEGSSDPRASIYAAGATLYTLLTNRLPEASSPRKHNPAISHATAHIVQRALNQRPEARFSSIRDLRKALGRAKPGDKVAIDLGEAPRSIPIAPLLGGLLVVGLVLAAVFSLRSYEPTAVAALSTETPAFTSTPRPTGQPTARPTDHPTPAPSVRPSSTRTPTREPDTKLTPQAGTTALAATDNMILAFVPGGDFLMGSPDSDPQAFGNEKPQFTASVSAFWIDKTEITNTQYQKCVEAEACTVPSGFDSATRQDYYDDPLYADYPVVWVNWVQATAYCEWADRRLPTEVEWEKAARGTDGSFYPWGNEPPNNTLLNFNLAADDTTQVGSFPNGASPYGALDMAGNVVEWVDGYYYDSYFVFVRNTVTPTASFLGGVRILRSSSWNDLFENIRVASRRYSVSATAAFNDVGFRCASTNRP